jgi:hypothetical protein
MPLAANKSPACSKNTVRRWKRICLQSAWCC